MIQLQRQPRTDARKKFRGYKTEKPTGFRKAEVREDSVYQELCGIWTRVPYFNDVQFSYEACVEAIGSFRCSAEDITKFTINFPEPESSGIVNTIDYQIKEGVFLTALMNLGNNSDHELFVGNFHLPPSGIGHLTDRNIIVHGDVWNLLGSQMRGGSIVVYGNASGCTGQYMKGGKIIVHGNTNSPVGYEMRGGEIEINGKAELALGHYMKGGRIIINGDYHPVFPIYPAQNMDGGEIHINGNILYVDANDLLGKMADWITKGRFYYQGKLIIDK